MKVAAKSVSASVRGPHHAIIMTTVRTKNRPVSSMANPAMPESVGLYDFPFARRNLIR